MSSTKTLLVIDDDRSIHSITRSILKPEWRSLHALTGQDGIDCLGSDSVDAVLLDIQLPDVSGLKVFEQIHDFDAKIPVIFITSEGGGDQVIEAMQMGAFDYVVKPLNVHSLSAVIQKAFDLPTMIGVPLAIAADEEVSTEQLFIGSSPAMVDIFKAISRVAKQDISVLVRGETGTGKELVARSIVQHSHRKDSPFLAVNCAAITETLLESELFGHEKGAFTGADSRRIGKFEQAKGGTLFLDEVGDMALPVQAKLLRVLQEKTFERVGGNQVLTADVRVIAATNQPLERMVEQGTFRGDLLFRLDGVTISVPPLRERKQDIPRLLKYFLFRAKRDFNVDNLLGITSDASRLLEDFAWPGNVRQLQALLRRLVIESSTGVITAEDLPPEFCSVPDVTSPDLRVDRPSAEETSKTSGPIVPTVNAAPSLDDLITELLSDHTTDIYAKCLEQMERRLFLRVLQSTGGNQSQAAELLGITRGKVRDRITSYGINLEGKVTLSD